MTVKTTELAACPFCGKEPVLLEERESAGLMHRQGEWLAAARAVQPQPSADVRAALEKAKAWMEEVTDPCGEPYNTICNVLDALSTPSAGQPAGQEASPDDIRANGWTVAVHNDYRLNGKAHTFWLFTKGDIAVKGEGETDAEALAAVRAKIGLPAAPAPAEGLSATPTQGEG